MRDVNVNSGLNVYLIAGGQCERWDEKLLYLYCDCNFQRTMENWLPNTNYNVGFVSKVMVKI